MSKSTDVILQDAILQELLDCLVRTESISTCWVFERIGQIRDAIHIMDERYNTLAMKYEQTESYLLSVNRRLQEQLFDMRKIVDRCGHENS